MAISWSQKIWAKNKIRAYHPALMKAGQNAQKPEKMTHLVNYGYQSGPKKFGPKKK